MRKVFKYKLANPQETIMVPTSAKFLTAQIQYGDICVWAEVGDEADQKAVTFSVVGTGHHFDASGADYIGSVQMQGGALVFHIYVRTDLPPEAKNS